MPLSQSRRFVSVDTTFTTYDEVTKKQREKANKEAQERKFAQAYPTEAMRRAILRASKEGAKGLVWNVFLDLECTVMVESIDGEFLADVVNQLLDTLTSRERFVLEHRYGFNGCSPMTYKALGLICPRLREWDYEKGVASKILKYEDGVVGTSGSRVQQIEWKALRMLRHPSRSRRLEKFLVRTRVVSP